MQGTCRCGCGLKVGRGKLFIRGHNRKINIDSVLLKKLYLKEKKSCAEISYELGYGITTIRRKLRSSQVRLRTLKEASAVAVARSKKHMQSLAGQLRHSFLMQGHQWNRSLRYNRDYFKKFSRNMAYILGYIAADGCITNKSLVLCSKDKELLEKINSKLRSEAMIRKKKGYYHLVFNSVTMVNDLVRRGITQRKTFTLKPIPMPRKFRSDFIRGVFDGDGCFAYHKTLNTYKSMITNASRDLLVWIHNNLPTKQGVVYKRKDTNCYELRYGLADTLLFGRFIYKGVGKDIICLERKRDIFNNIIQHVSAAEAVI